MNKLGYIQTTEYNLVIKRNKLSNHEKTRRKRKCILLSKRSQTKKATAWFQLYSFLEKAELWRQQTWVVAVGWLDEGRGGIYKQR